MKNKCQVINDLLPLYVDQVCSKESRILVEEHIAECRECQNTLNMMRKDIKDAGDIRDTQGALIKKIKRRLRIEKLVLVFAVLFVLGNIVFFGGLDLITSMVHMQEVDIQNEIGVELDDDGNIWILRSGKATDAKAVVYDQYNGKGEVITNFEEEVINQDVEKTHVVCEVKLYENKYQQLMHKLFKQTFNIIDEERSILLNIKEKENVDKVVIKQNGEERVLWER